MWIDSQNFDILLKFKKGRMSLTSFMGGELEEPEFKVAFNDLSTAQKKMLVDIEVDFKLYVSSGRPNPNLKDKIVKETLFDKDDIVSLIKSILNEENRISVIEKVMGSSIPPVVIQQWLYQGAMGTDAWETVVIAEKYTGNVEAYACLMGTKDVMNAKFKFPKKVRSD